MCLSYAVQELRNIALPSIRRGILIWILVFLTGLQVFSAGLISVTEPAGENRPWHGDALNASFGIFVPEQ